MHKTLKVLKSISNKLLLIFFGLLIIGGLPTLVLTDQISTKDTVKEWLSDSNFYENLLDNVVEIAAFGEEGVDNAPTLADELRKNGDITPEEFTTRFKNIIPPEYFQAQMETLIDAYYGWLFEDQTLAYSIDLSDRRDIFIDEMSDFMKSFFNGLPVCPANQLEVDTEDLFSIACRPEGVNVNQQVDELVDELESELDIFDQKFTEQDLDATEEQLRSAREYVITSEDSDDIRLGSVISAANQFNATYYVMIILIGGLIVLTGKTYRRGFRSVGFSLAIIGLFNLIIWRILFSNLDSSTESFVEDESLSAVQQEAVNNVVEPLAKTVIRSLRDNVSSLALTITIIGIIIIGWYYFSAKRIHDKHHEPKGESLDKLKAENKDKTPKEKKDSGRTN